MEALLKRDVNFMWVSDMQSPDFNTINLFRKHRLADVMDGIVWKKATKTNQNKLDLKVKSMLREAERVFNMELKDESDNVKSAEAHR